MYFLCHYRISDESSSCVSSYNTTGPRERLNNFDVITVRSWLVMPLGIQALPLELIGAITGSLSLRDFYSLRHASKTLFTLLGGEGTCREVIKVCLMPAKYHGTN